MVVAVLAALMAIAAPFVFSMIQHGRSARNDLNQQVARELAQGAADHGIADRIRKTNDYFYQYSNGNFHTALPPEVLAQRDLQVDMSLPFNDVLVKKYDLDTNLQNPQGQMWSCTVTDEQGKINVTTAPPALLGNLLGSAILTEGVKKGETQLVVDDTKQFNPNGGLVGMNGEPTPLAYSSASGGIIQLQQPVVYSHTTGTLIYDGRARLICNALMPGGSAFAPFRSVYEIKQAPGLTGSNALATEEFARIERHLTVENGMNSPLWGHGETLSDTRVTGSVSGVQLLNGHAFCPGTLVRITSNGEASGFGRVRDAQYNPVMVTNSAGQQSETNSGVWTIDFEQSMGGSGGGGGSSSNSPNGATYLEPQLKHPINLNTASDEVLVAAFTGVCMRQGKDAVSRATAQNLVNFLRGKGVVTRNGERPVFTSHDDLRKALYRARERSIISLPQRDALILNATEPNSAKLRQCTTTFIYFSHGTFTIEGSGVANSDVGNQLARHTIQELVTMPTPLPGRFLVNYQQGFQELIDQGMGSRVNTYPIILGRGRFKAGAPLDRYAKVDQGNVRLDVGESASLLGLASLFNIDMEQHFNDETVPGYKYEGQDMSRVGAYTLGAPQLGANRSIAGMNVPLTAGTPPASIELWYRPRSNSQCTFYDEGSQDNRNRTMFCYDPSENGLVIRIWDACLPGPKSKPVEFIYPITMNVGDWYHVAASWKTSHPGGQEIRVDAQPFPNNDPTSLLLKPGGRLATALSTTDVSQITLQDGDGLDEIPAMGALKIGEEVIEYTGHSGTTFTGIFRGARMSAVVKHNAGEWVIPFGFVNYTYQDLVVGNATLSEDLDTSAKTTTQIMVPPNTQPPYVLDTAIKITVADASSFPPSGFVLCSGELIYYGTKARNGAVWELSKLQRGMTTRGVTGAQRNLRGQVTLCSVQISNIADYPLETDQDRLIQIDDQNVQNKVEWIGYGDKQTINGKQYLLAFIDIVNTTNNPGANYYYTGQPSGKGGNQTPNPALGTPHTGPAIDFAYRTGNAYNHDHGFRNKYHIGSIRYLGGQVTSSHTKGAKIIPVIKMNAPHCGGFDPKNPAEAMNLISSSTTSSGSSNGSTEVPANLVTGPAHDSPYGPDGVSDVSVVEINQQDGDLRWVKQAFMDQESVYNGNGVFVAWNYYFYVGLNDFVSRRYPGQTTRYLHWPSG